MLLRPQEQVPTPRLPAVTSPPSPLSPDAAVRRKLWPVRGPAQDCCPFLSSLLGPVPDTLDQGAQPSFPHAYCRVFLIKNIFIYTNR